MIKVTRINGQNRDSFLPAVDALSLAVCDVILGAYDEKTDTACGILAAESVNNEQLGYTLAIRHIYVDEEWRGKGAGKALVNALMDLTTDAGAKAVMCCHLEAEDETEELSGFLEAMEFKRTRDSLPLFGFRLSEIETGSFTEQIRCVPLKSLENREWKEFVRFAGRRSAVINVRNYYEDSISFVAFDDDSDIRGALLCSRRGQVLCVDVVLTVNDKGNKTLEALISHAVSEAQKLYSPGTEIGIMLKDPEQEMILKELTGFKTEKVGSYIAHVVL